MVYVSPPGVTRQVVSRCPVLDLALVGAAYAGLVGTLDGEALPERFAAFRHCMRLLAGSIELHASSKISGICACAPIPINARPTLTIHLFMVSSF